MHSMHYTVRAIKGHGVRAFAGALSLVMAFAATAPICGAYAESLPGTSDASVTASDVRVALVDMSGVLAASDTTKTTSDKDSAIIASNAGTVVDIPKDPSTGVTLGSADGTRIDVALPNADDASNAQKVANGVVAYPNDNGSATAVQAVEDGSVRMLTVIDNASAPTEYAYKVTLPSGGRVEVAPDGTALVLDSDSQVVVTASAPWAKDADGRMVQTYFTTDGTTLVQHVSHNVTGVTYPVIADPWWAPARIDHVTWVNTPWGRSLHVYVTWYGYTTSFLAPGSAFNEVMQKASIGWSGSLYNQFVCHADIAPPWKESWNLDTWRPDVGLWQTIVKKCNP